MTTAIAVVHYVLLVAGATFVLSVLIPHLVSWPHYAKFVWFRAKSLGLGAHITFLERRRDLRAKGDGQ